MKRKPLRIVASIVLSLFSMFLSGFELMGQNPEGLTKISCGFPIIFLEFYLLPSESWSFFEFFHRLGTGRFYLNVVMFILNCLILFIIITFVSEVILRIYKNLTKNRNKKNR